MTVIEVMTRLEALGNEKTRALNLKNGAGENQFGVKMGDLRVLAKEIKIDPALATELWKTGNVEARLLSTLIARPKLITVADLETMVREATYSWLADWVNSYVVKAHPAKESLRTKWMDAEDPMLRRSGWSLSTERVTKSPDGLDVGALLDRLEQEMATAPAEAQWTMNFCLGEIGINFPEHRERVLTFAEQLGLYRDYPCSKGCTSPFVPLWVAEMVSRQS